MYDSLVRQYDYISYGLSEAWAGFAGFLIVMFSFQCGKIFMSTYCTRDIPSHFEPTRTKVKKTLVRILVTSVTVGALAFILSIPADDEAPLNHHAFMNLCVKRLLLFGIPFWFGTAKAERIPQEPRNWY